MYPCSKLRLSPPKLIIYKCYFHISVVGSDFPRGTWSHILHVDQSLYDYCLEKNEGVLKSRWWSLFSTTDSGQRYHHNQCQKDRQIHTKVVLPGQNRRWSWVRYTLQWKWNLSRATSFVLLAPSGRTTKNVNSGWCCKRGYESTHHIR